MTPQDAEEYTQALGQVVAGGWRQIALGQRLGVPKALKLSVDEWVKKRLGGYVRLNMDEAKEAFAELAAQGFKQREIADVTGVDQSTVSRTLNDANASTKHGKAKRNGHNGKANDANASTEAVDALASLAATNAVREQLEMKATREQREQQNKAALHRKVTVTAAGLIHGDFRARYADTLAPESVQRFITKRS